MSRLPISDKLSRGRNHASITSILPYRLAESLFHKSLQNQRAESNLKGVFFWCILNLTPLIAERGGVQCISNGLTMGCPYTEAECRRIYKIAHFFWFTLHLPVSLESAESWVSGVGHAVRVSGCFPRPPHLGRTSSSPLSHDSFIV